MKHSIEQTSEGLRINASVTPEKQNELLEEFAKCAGGTCSCPTPQYAKVQSIDVTGHATGVTVNLKIKPGEAIDVAVIEQCLDHTAKQIGG